MSRLAASRAHPAPSQPSNWAIVIVLPAGNKHLILIDLGEDAVEDRELQVWESTQQHCSPLVPVCAPMQGVMVSRTDQDGVLEVPKHARARICLPCSVLLLKCLVILRALY